jgi:steroid delta-isomerase-like uncharacterized protein
VNREHTFQLIQAYYAAFNACDDEKMLALLSTDVAHDINQGVREVGRAAFASFLRRMHTSYEETLSDVVVSVSEDGSRAAAEYLVHGKYKQADLGMPPARGQLYELPGGAFFSVSKGEICRVTNYYNLEDWLRQVR